MAPREWTCQRTTNGVKCGHKNLRKYKICRACEKRRPALKRTKAQAPVEPLERYIERQGGYYCVIGRMLDKPCGQGLKVDGTRIVLHRDHDHATDTPRGLLCFRHNQQLKAGFDARTLRAMADYLERYE